MNRHSQYAKVVWKVEDVQTLFDVTDKEAGDFLNQFSGQIQDRLVEVGWGVLETLGVLAGLKPVDEEGEDESTASEGQQPPDGGGHP